MADILPRDSTLEELQYNVSYWTQALVKNASTRIRFDAPEQILYTPRRTIIPLFSSDFINYFTQFIPSSLLAKIFIENIQIITRDMAPLFSSIEESLRSWNLIILSNHASWLNLPFIALLLQKLAKIPPQRIYTLLWPAITTRELAYGWIINFSNLIKTVPDTLNGNVEIGRMVTRIRKNMYQVVRSKFLLEESSGNILLVAPSGTTDTFDQTNWTFHLEKPSQWTEGFLSLLSKKRDNRFLIFGMNDKAIMPDNSSLKRGSAYMRISSSITWNEVLEVLKLLPSYVVNRDWESIWSWKNGEKKS